MEMHLIISQYRSLLLALRNQLAHHQILFEKPALPISQGGHFFFVQVLKIIQGPMQILGQHVIIEAPASQSATRIPPCEILIRSPGPVEVAPGGNVKDLTAYGEVDGLAVLAIKGYQFGGREGFEDGGWWTLGDDGGRRRAKAVVGKHQEEGEEDQINGCGNGGTREAVSLEESKNDW